MACRLSASGSYTVVIIPLMTSLHSQEALRFYLWIKRMKDLEKEKDALWSGLEVLEKGRLWYFQRLEENRALRCVATRYSTGARSCLPTHIQRVNGSLGSIMSEPNVSSNPCLCDPLGDSDLRWRNTVLTQVHIKLNKF
uniref:Suppressor APC domain containing 1 n=1 Tax=Poecilia mexicana TaxID=48701 RepID=A0A3B3XWW5_9TELE